MKKFRFKVYSVTDKGPEIIESNSIDDIFNIEWLSAYEESRGKENGFDHWEFNESEEPFINIYAVTFYGDRNLVASVFSEELRD